jgi:hypothetical protein
MKYLLISFGVRFVGFGVRLSTVQPDGKINLRRNTRRLFRKRPVKDLSARRGSFLRDRQSIIFFGSVLRDRGRAALASHPAAWLQSQVPVMLAVILKINIID